MRRCGCCGQSLPEVRLGVTLTPLKARIFDLIRRAGPDGIPGDDLFASAFVDRPKRVTRSCLKSHTQQINDYIMDSGYKIIPDRGRGGSYRLMKISNGSGV